ncbi:hypothetical protein HK100_012296 [Physocladia obscura]|uniref:D-lactate dehydratase n=1 Tax=Physocladia obscura TaxID=109957 RepID=A0AAD5T1Q0_9FUNG|nr:hypothetical protein HK100_012296 [Physocladia obscura]
MKSILFIVTNHSELGSTGKKTGYWVSEVAHPYNYLKNKYNIVFASPKGGVSPVDPGSVVQEANDKVSVEFLADPVGKELIANTKVLSTLKPKDFDAILYPGGHGPMYDLFSDATSNAFAAESWELGKVIASVCHGPAGIANVKLSDGTFLVAGKNLTGFANTEEDAVQLSSVVPFLLEDKLKENGGKYTKIADWVSYVVADGKLVTGQNPASAEGVAKKIDELLS